jgi:MFS family permease
MPPPSTPPATAPGAHLVRRGLLVLTLINLLNYLDRFVLSALVESLRLEMRLDGFRLGMLQTAFIVVYMAASPIFGTLGDRGSRTRLLCVGVALWSAATAVSGFARGFVGLLVGRAAVGVGEAAYGAIAPSLLADYYPQSRRGRVFAIFFSAIPIGAALGYVLGGIVDHRYGWRAAFWVAGMPGLLLALFTLGLWDPPRGMHDPAPAGAVRGRGVAATYGSLLRNGPFVLTVAGYAAYTFGVGAMAFWMPAFLERCRGIPREAATVQFGAVVVVTGFVGTFAGGWLGDALLRRNRQAYLWVSGGTALLAAPMAALALTATSPALLWIGIVTAELLLFASTGPVNSALVNQVSAWERASAVGLTNFAIHLFGDVPSPPLIGALSDASSLEKAVLLVPAAVLVGGVIWCWAAWRSLPLPGVRPADGPPDSPAGGSDPAVRR